MDPGVKSFLCEHESLSLESLGSCKASCSSPHLEFCNPRAAWEAETGQFLEAHEPASLAYAVVSKREAVLNQVRMDRHPRLSSDFHTCMIACTHLHLPVNTCIYKKK